MTASECVRRWLPILSLTGCILGASDRAQAAALTGTVRIPGTSHKVDYSYDVEPDPNDPRKVRLVMKIRPVDWDGAGYSFWFCCMVQTPYGVTDMPHWSVKVANGCWSCEREGTINGRRSWHFGCRQITISINDNPPHFQRLPDGSWSWYTVIDESSEALDINISRNDIASIYGDFLENLPWCSGKMCPEVAGANKHLGPAFSDIVLNAVNIWGARFRPGTCGEAFCATARWETGNWVTMSFPGEYASRIVGDITNAPAGSTFTFTAPGQFKREYTASVEGAIHVDEPLVIGRDSDKPDYDMTLVMTAPKAPPDGTVVRFTAQVLGAPGNPRYEPGAPMYGIDAVLVQDSRPPVIRRVEARRLPDRPGFVRITTLGSDAETTPFAAFAEVSDGATTRSVPLDTVEPIDDRQQLFVAESGPYAAGARLRYRVWLYDEAGNSTVSRPAELRGTEVRRPR